VNVDKTDIMVFPKTKSRDILCKIKWNEYRKCSPVSIPWDIC